MTHKDKYEQAIAAIQIVHSDTSVPLETTRDSLLGLGDEIDMLVEAVSEDIKGKANKGLPNINDYPF